MTNFTDEIRQTVTPHKFGGDKMAAALYLLANESGQDEETGNVDWDFWVGRFGRRLLFEDSNGFVWVQKFQNEDEAKGYFADIEADYSGQSQTYESETSHGSR
jgi:hypothetical protein